MEFIYNPQGVCSQKMIIKMNGRIVEKVQIIGGCAGNTAGVSKLVEGMDIDDVIKRLKGIPCRSNPTSCPDQLAKALEEIKKKIA